MSVGYSMDDWRQKGNDMLQATHYKKAKNTRQPTDWGSLLNTAINGERESVSAAKKFWNYASSKQAKSLEYPG